MTFKVFVDGQAGTTGLQIHQRLAKYSNLEVLELPYEDRKNIGKKQEIINQSDVIFLCLPDDAARETVSLVQNDHTRIIDASSAHRVSPGWVYGLPELDAHQRERVASSRRVSVTGCHASASILSLKPLISQSVLPANALVSIHSITGYSGGGKGMIADYESGHALLQSPRHYALGLSHKHLPEIMAYSGLTTKPVFVPIVANYLKGLAVSIPLHTAQFSQKLSAKEVHNIISTYYQHEDFINVLPFSTEAGTEQGFYNIQACNETNRVDIAVYGDADQLLILTRLDNLGKGASGAALQCMNLMLGLDEKMQLTY